MTDLASHLRAWIERTAPDEPMRRYAFGRGMAQRDRELLREIEAWEDGQTYTASRVTSEKVYSGKASGVVNSPRL